MSFFDSYTFSLGAFVVFAIGVITALIFKLRMGPKLLNIPPVTKLSERIIRILGCNPGMMTLQGTNSYIIGTGKRRILLDTTEPGSSSTRYVQQLKTVFQEENIKICHILLSHWHPDHVGAVKNILTLTGSLSNCKVWKFPSNPNKNVLLDGVNVEPLTNNQEFIVDGATLHVLHTPGHTTDHAVFVLQEENAVFSGDCILGEGTSIFEDLFDYMKSLNQILNLKPSVVYPGHGNVIHDAQQRIEYYISHRNKREQQILDVLKKEPTQSFSEWVLVRKIYKETPMHLWPAAKSNVNHHLVKLCKENRVLHVGKQWQYRDISKM